MHREQVLLSSKDFRSAIGLRACSFFQYGATIPYNFMEDMGPPLRTILGRYGGSILQGYHQNDTLFNCHLKNQPGSTCDAICSPKYVFSVICEAFIIIYCLESCLQSLLELEKHLIRNLHRWLG